MLTWLLASALAADTVIAVLPFSAHTADERLAPLGYGLSDMLVTDLHGADGVVLVERSRIDRVLAELTLQQTDFADPKTAAELGRGVGATHVLIGSLTDALGGVRLDARLVEVSTGDVSHTAKSQGPPETVLALEAALATDLLTALGAPRTVTAGTLSFDELLAASSQLADSETQRLRQLRAVHRYRQQAWRREHTSFAVGDGSVNTWQVVDGGGDFIEARYIAETLHHESVLAEMAEADAVAQRWWVGGKRVGIGAAALLTATLVTNGVRSARDKQRLPGSIAVLSITPSIAITAPIFGLMAKSAAENNDDWPGNWYEPQEMDEALDQRNAELAKELGVSEEQRLRTHLAE